MKKSNENQKCNISTGNLCCKVSIYFNKKEWKIKFHITGRYPTFAFKMIRSLCRTVTNVITKLLRG